MVNEEMEKALEVPVEVKRPVEKKPDIKAEIISLVKKKCAKFNKNGDVDAYLQLLTLGQWKVIFGDVDGADNSLQASKAKSWQKHDTVEKKAEALSIFIKHDIAPKKTIRAIKG